MRHLLPVLVCLLALAAGPAAAQNNECDQPGEAPDVIVGDLHQIRRHGEIGGVTAFSVGTVSCNVGSCWLEWFDSTPAHPVIGQNLFRLESGRFEQIGQSWLKHGFLALSQELCSTGCLGTGGTHLGVNCSDPYSSFLNGDQPGLGPKFEVNAATGGFPYPFTAENQTGDALYKRLQVANDDLDPALHPGASYYVEGQYVTADDAAAGNDDNNASYRPVTVVDSGGQLSLQLAGTTVRGEPAIMAWGAADPTVETVFVDVPSDGRFVAAAKTTALGGGQWRYEYAIHNLNSHRAAGGFRVPLPPGTLVSNVGFHDVGYHSGEPYDGTDWPSTTQNAELSWSTTPVSVDANANALRWGTLYNFRFEANRAPQQGDLTLELFRPGLPGEVSWRGPVPSPCDGDAICDAGESPCNCPADCGTPTATEQVCDDGIDDDCDLRTDCDDLDCCATAICDDGVDADGDGVTSCDCDDTNAAFWAVPGEARALTLEHAPQGTTQLAWQPPFDPGGTVTFYDVLRSDFPDQFDQLGVACEASTSTSWEETGEPREGEVGHYLIRATNRCPGGVGPLGVDSTGAEREGIAACP